MMPEICHGVYLTFLSSLTCVNEECGALSSGPPEHDRLLTYDKRRLEVTEFYPYGHIATKLIFACHCNAPEIESKQIKKLDS
jgi:hypothetical protein